MIRCTTLSRMMLSSLAAFLVLILLSPVQGQQTFELSGGTFKKVHEPDPRSAEGELNLFREKLAEGYAEDVICCLDIWIEENPFSDMLPYAYMLRGDAKVQKDDLYLALFDYEHVAKFYPGTKLFREALQRQLEISVKFAKGRGRKAEFWKYTGILYFLSEIPLFDADEEAEEILIRIQERAPGSVLAERAGKELADMYYRMGEMPKAAIAYELFQKNYPTSEYTEYALQRQIEANLARFKGPAFDATGLFEAKNRIEVFIRFYPASARRAGAEELALRIEEALAEKILFNAQWYDAQEAYVPARFTYYRVIKKHPTTVAAQVAYRRLKQLDPRLSVYAREMLTDNYAAIMGKSDLEITKSTPGDAALVPTLGLQSNGARFSEDSSVEDGSGDSSE